MTKVRETATIQRVPAVYFDKVCDSIINPAKAKFSRAGVKDVEPICKAGNPADEILNAAKKYKVDAIIMGSRGLGGFSRAIMGSVSTKVCNFAEVTCITVK
jgi:nucleotide-binding universal stress UspA family protein